MQKIKHWSATNAILLTQCLCIITDLSTLYTELSVMTSLE